MKKSFLVSGVIIVGIGILGIAIYHRTTTKSSGHQTVVQITASGFTPNTVVVKKGAQIIWKNVDSAPHVVASNPFPADSSVLGLHSQTILPNGSYTYTPTKTGTINYHDNIQPTHNGIIEVQK